MYKYQYRAIDAVGKKKTGTITAEDDKVFRQILRESDLKCYEYRILNKKRTKSFKKLKTADLIAFSRQLSSMLVAGLSLALSLEMLYEKTEKKKKQLKQCLAFLFESVQKGESLAGAMALMDPTFPSLYVSMVKSGEMSGKIDETLVNLANHYEKEKKQHNQIKGAMSYPIILLVVSVLVVAVLLVVVMPKMIAMIPEGQAIPLPTRILLAIKDFVTKNIAVVAVVVVVLVIMTPIVKRIPPVALFLGRVATRIPKIGKLRRMIYTSQFARNISTLYASGVALLDAIQMTSEIISNAYIKRKLRDAIAAIRRGSSIADALSTIDSFDPLLITMIFVGEQSGSLDDILVQTAAYFEEESDVAIKGLTGMITPVMLMFMAVVIGFSLIAIMMPMFSVYQSVG